MQSQAAPARFSHIHPLVQSIPVHAVPTPLRVVIEAPQFNHYLKRLYGQTAYIRRRDDEYVGTFPQLLLNIRDPEIRQLAGMESPTANRVWLDRLPLFDTIDCADVTCTCKALKEHDFEAVLGNGQGDDAILYRSCKRTLFAAAKRQLKAAPTPDAKMLQQFIGFAKTAIEKHMGQDLRDFGYSYNQWFNHLTKSKQDEMAEIHAFFWSPDGDQKGRRYCGINSIPEEYLIYEAICKKEIQGPDGKPRMVCKIPLLIKYVMGPVTWKLEEIAAKHFPSYCGGMNLTEMANKINHYIDDGFDLVAEGDGSAFDNTQDVTLKAVDRYIYNAILDRIHHVPREVFEMVANQYYKVMDVVHNDPITKRRRVLLRYAVLGTVFSGDCDTTLMNTIRMGLYVWFWNHMEGLRFGRHFICFSKGDDFTIMYNPHLGRYINRQSYLKYFLAKAKPNAPNEADNRQHGLGQIMKFVEFGTPLIIKFCSLRAWYTDPVTGHIVLTRDPSKFAGLSKYSRKTRLMQGKAIGYYCLDQAEALHSSYLGLHYFDAMADAYMAVYQQTINLAGARDYRKCLDKRVTLPLETLDSDGLYAPREQIEVIQQTLYGSGYWDTMKAIYTARPGALTPEETEFVNFQIDQEFNSHELATLVERA